MAKLILASTAVQPELALGLHTTSSTLTASEERTWQIAVRKGDRHSR